MITPFDFAPTGATETVPMPPVTGTVSETFDELPELEQSHWDAMCIKVCDWCLGWGCGAIGLVLIGFVAAHKMGWW